MRNSFYRLCGAAFGAALLFCGSTGGIAAATSCRSVAACIFGTNTASGPGVQGSSTSGYGVEGTSNLNDGAVGHTAVNSTSPGTGKAGVAGYDDSTNKTPYNSGVYGASQYAAGLQGRSTFGPGLVALSAKSNAVAAISGVALFSGFTNAGIVAQSSSGDGLIAVGNTTAVAGFATTGCSQVNCSSPLQAEIPSGGALSAGTDFGGLGLNIVTDTNPLLPANLPQGVGAMIDSGSVGMMITPDRQSNGNTGLIVNGSLSPRDFSGGFQGAIISGFDALSVTSVDIGLAVSGGSGPGGGAAIIAQSAVNGATLFQGNTSTGTATSALDDAGNLVLAGTLKQKGTVLSELPNSDGTSSAAYAANSTLPTIDDMGEANLAAGTAFVTISPALRKFMNVSRGYLVFLTPQGATTGLYVGAKSAAGFSVREIGNARDSLAFDYRIVAHPYADAGSHGASTALLDRVTTQRKALFYRHLKPLRFKRGKLDRSSLPIPSL